MINKKKSQTDSKISQNENTSKENISTGKISKGENVNEFNKALEELSFNELLLKSFFDSPGHMRGIVELVNGTDIKHIKTNLQTARYLNLTPADLEGKLSSELGEPLERMKIWIEHYKISQKTGSPVSWEYVDIEGLNTSWLAPTVAYIGKTTEGTPRFTYDIINITDRKKAEEALYVSEELSRQRLTEIEELYRNAPIGLCTLDRNLRFLRINERLAELNGIPSADHIGKTVRDLLPTLADAVEPGMRRVLETGEPQLNIEIVSETPAMPGIQRTWLEKWVPTKDPYGRINGLSIVVEEITMRKKAEEAMNDAQRMTQSLINHTPAIVYAFDLEKRFLLANTSLADLLDSTPEAMIGKRRHEFMPKDDADWHDANDSKVFTKGRPVEFEEYSQLKDRSITWLTTKFPLHDSQGRIYAVAGISNDITERKEAEKERKESEAKLRESQGKLSIALESGKIGIWEWNLDTDEVIWDEKMEKMFGLKSGTFGKTYKAFVDLINEEDLSHIQKATLDSIEKDIPFGTIFRTKSNECKVRFISSKALINRDSNGKAISFTGVSFDVTELKEGTEQLVTKLNEEILRSNKELESFAYVASHDLQEPLRMVTSFTQLLAQQYKDKLDDKAMEYIDFAIDGSKRMYDLLNGLLTYSRINTKGKEFAKIDLREALDCAIKNLSLIITEKKVFIKSETLPVVRGDASQMDHLFQNLISNSIKFSLKSPRIYISSKSNTDHYIISVKDNGIGIESQYFEKIFQIFQRLHTRDQYEGTGIGLFLCRRTVERHGGKIWVESEPGNGSTFFFTIPKNTQ